MQRKHVFHLLLSATLLIASGFVLSIQKSEPAIAAPGPNEPAGYSAISGRAFNSLGQTNPATGYGMGRSTGGTLPYLTGLSEGWDDIERTYTRFQLAQDPTAPLSPPSIMRAMYPARVVPSGSTDSPGVVQMMGINQPQAYYGTVRNYRNIYFRTAFRVSANWVGNPSSTNKMFFVRSTFGFEPIVRLRGAGSGPLTLNVDPQGSEGPGGDPRASTGGFNPNTSAATAAGAFNIQRGQWYVLEGVMGIGTDGQQNGVLKLWLNGVLTHNYADVEYQKDGVTTNNWGYIHIAPTWGGGGGTIPADQWLDFDDFYVSGSAGGTTPPSSDTQPPSVSISSPVPNATVTGTISITANASDNVGVAGVQFKINGTNQGVEDTNSPYTISLDTATKTNGSYALTAFARDAAGNSTLSGVVNVTINNALPPADTTAPTVSITAPSAGVTLSGATNTVDATASDNVRVIGVQFQLDGINIGAEDTVSPYSVNLDTTTKTNNSHILTAIARDAAGNSKISSSVTININNAVSSGPQIITLPAFRSNITTVNQNRVVKIYLPPGYANSTSRYPVMYIQGDGDFGGGMSYDTVATSLIQSGIIEPIIMVGIFTDASGSEWLPTNTAKAINYQNMVMNELIPYIDANYRTKANAANRGTMGVSAGGQTAIALANHNTGVFGKLATFSPPLAATVPDEVAYIAGLSGPGPKWYWSRGQGGDGGTPGTSQHLADAALIAALNANNCPAGTCYLFEPLPANGLHSTTYFKTRVDPMLRFLFPLNGTPPPITPTLNFSANPTTVNPGQSTTLSWTTTNVTSCSASTGWSGNVVVNGSQSVSPTQTNTFTLTCTGAGGSITRTATVTVNAVTPPPSGNATIQDLGLIPSSLLGNSRRVEVYLPPGYSTSTSRYPVLYLHDGQDIFGSANAFYMERTLTPLIVGGSVKPVIVVAIHGQTNAVARGNEYIWAAPAIGQLYARMVVEELKPRIDSTFRTLTGPATTGIGGVSLGSSLSMEMAFKYPNIFGLVVAQSGTFKPQNGSFNQITVVQNYPGKLPFRLYFDRGTLDGETYHQGVDQEMRAALLAKGMIEGVDFKYQLIQNAQHGWGFWATRIDDFMIFLFPPGSLPPPPPPPITPTLNFSANPTTVNPGQSTTLSWTTTNVTSCSASTGWSGNVVVNGSQSVSPTQTNTFTLTCTGAGGSITRTATVTVNAVTPPNTGHPNQPAGYTAIVNRAFNSSPTFAGDRGTGSFPSKTGGSEGWDDVERSYANIGRVTDETSATISPPNVLRFTYVPGTIPASTTYSPGVAQSQSFTSATHGNLTNKKVYLDFGLKLSSGFQYHSTGVKVMFMRSNSGAGGKFEPIIALSPTSNIQVDLQGTEDNGRGNLQANTGNSAFFSTGAWHRVEAVMQMNSAYGVADGILKVWLDGQLIHNYSNIKYLRDATNTYYWDTIHIAPTWGGLGGNINALQYMYFDNVYASGAVGTSLPPPPVGDTQAPTTPANLTASGITTNQAVISWNGSSDNVGVAGYKVFRNGVQIGTSTNTNFTSTGLNASTGYTYAVSAYDAAGNNSLQSIALTVTTQSPPDTTQPNVSITNPAANITVLGTVTVTANASDNVGVVGVQFKLNGVNIGTEDTTSPYSVSLDTTTRTNGSYSLTALARDAAGNQKTSAAINFTISNAAVVASINILPTSLSLNRGLSAQLTALAKDAANVTITSVNFVWTSANSSIASVSSLGLVTANAVGTTTITASAAGKSAQIPVTIINTQDTQAPTTPTNLVSSNISSTQATVSWSASTDNVGVTGYKVFRNGVQVGTSSTTSFINNIALNPATTYTYTISAYDAAGNNSPLSATLSVTTTAVSVPCTITSLSAIPSTVNAGQTTILSWLTTGNCINGILNGGAFNSFSIVPQSSTVVTATLSQSTTYTLNFGSVSQQVLVTVNPATQPAPGSVSQLDANPKNVNLVLGRTSAQVNVLFKDAAGNVLPAQLVTWQVADPSIVTISNNNVINALALGSTTATATWSNLTVTINIRVDAASVTQPSGGGGAGSNPGSTPPVGSGPLAGGPTGNTAPGGIVQTVNGPVSRPPRTLVKYPGDPTVYLLENNTIHPVPSLAMFQQQYATLPIATIQPAETYTQSSAVSFGPGALIKSPDQPTVYLILDDNSKYAFRSLDEMRRFGYNPVQIRQASPDEITTHTESAIPALTYHAAGTFIKYPNNPTIYKIENNIKRPITSLAVLNLHSDLSAVITISEEFQYQDGELLNFPDGSLIKGSDNTVYLIDQGEKKPFTSAEIFNGLGYSFDQIKLVPDSDLARHPSGMAF